MVIELLRLERRDSSHKTIHVGWAVFHDSYAPVYLDAGYPFYDLKLQEYFRDFMRAVEVLDDYISTWNDPKGGSRSDRKVRFPYEVVEIYAFPLASRVPIDFWKKRKRLVEKVRSKWNSIRQIVNDRHDRVCPTHFE